MFPAIVLVQAEADLNEMDATSGRLGLRIKCNPGFLRSSIRFERVTIDTGANNISQEVGPPRSRGMT
jgi:hypothetical protein